MTTIIRFMTGMAFGLEFFPASYIVVQIYLGPVAISFLSHQRLLDAVESEEL